MTEHWTIEEYKKYLNEQKRTEVNRSEQKSGQNRKSKYGAVKTKVDERVFDSKKEADFYSQLKLEMQAGEIRGFCLQPTFILAPGLTYKPDFIIIDKDKKAIIIDVKGFKTKEYIAKKKIFEDKYDLKIEEI